MSVVPGGSIAGTCIDAIARSGNGRDRRDCLIGLVCSLNRPAAIPPSSGIDRRTINFRLDDGLRCTSTRYGYQTLAVHSCPPSPDNKYRLFGVLHAYATRRNVPFDLFPAIKRTHWRCWSRGIKGRNISGRYCSNAIVWAFINSVLSLIPFDKTIHTTAK